MNLPRFITTSELAAQLLQEQPPVLIDVMLEEVFKTRHLPGAQNACVYDMAFLDLVKKNVPDPETPVIVYDSGLNNLASTTAAQKLIAAGYTHVTEFPGGLEEWQAAGLPVEGSGRGSESVPVAPDGRHAINLKKSQIEWTGRNLIAAHSGTIHLRHGSLEIENGRPVRGLFTLDMSTMQNTDIKDSKMRQMLMQHLVGEDFFDVEHFPDAEFLLSQITSLPAATLGSPNAQVHGKLTLKGVSREIDFLAILAVTPEGLLAADAHFDVDRTQWNVLYGSGKFYEKLGKHLVNDEISIGLKLITV
jgi:rhodanese-related sulfurtransferase